MCSDTGIWYCVRWVLFYPHRFFSYTLDVTLGKRWDHTPLSVDYLVLALGGRGRARGGGTGRREGRKSMCNLWLYPLCAILVKVGGRGEYIFPLSCSPCIHSRPFLSSQLSTRLSITFTPHTTSQPPTHTLHPPSPAKKKNIPMVHTPTSRNQTLLIVYQAWFPNLTTDRRGGRGG